MILGILQMPGVAHAAADGKRIYRRLCADCHGNKGEGVKGKYDDALHGDWSLEKLVRYIDKSMPEGAPEKCVGKDAEAVSRYIYDAFYSREARERNKPARVELARLTNKQYANVIADILLSVSGDTSSKTNAQPGLEVKGLSGDVTIQPLTDGGLLPHQEQTTLVSMPRVYGREAV